MKTKGDLTEKIAADQVGVSVVTLRAWLKGEKVTQEWIDKTIDILTEAEDHGIKIRRNKYTKRGKPTPVSVDVEATEPTPVLF